MTCWSFWRRCSIVSIYCWWQLGFCLVTLPMLSENTNSTPAYVRVCSLVHDAFAIVRRLQATPHIQIPSGKTFQDLTLADVWSTMREASLSGLDVPTCGSVLGRSSAYFVPLLSAMKLFTRGPNRRRKGDETPPRYAATRLLIVHETQWRRCLCMERNLCPMCRQAELMMQGIKVSL